MNTGTVLCLAFGAIFGILGIIFALLRDKTVILVSGFNTLPRKEREKYDQARLSADIRNLFIIWTAVFIA